MKRVEIRTFPDDLLERVDAQPGTRTDFILAAVAKALDGSVQPSVPLRAEALARGGEAVVPGARRAKVSKPRARNDARAWAWARQANLNKPKGL